MHLVTICTGVVTYKHCNILLLLLLVLYGDVAEPEQFKHVYVTYIQIFGLLVTWYLIL